MNFKYNNHVLDSDDPLLKAVPVLKNALLPTLVVDNFKSTHQRSDQNAHTQSDASNEEEALLACFEVLCVLDKNTKKPQPGPTKQTLDEKIESIAQSCGYGSREISLYSVDFKKETWPFLVFNHDGTSPKLIFQKKSKSYIYDPVTRQSQSMSSRIKRTLHPLSFTFYKQINQSHIKVTDLARAAYSETKKDLHRYFFLQLMIALCSLLIPVLSGMIFDDVLKLRQISFMQEIFMGMLVISVTSVLFRYIQVRSMTRLHLKSARFMQSAIWQRVLNFHLRFFRLFRLGDIHERAASIDAVQRSLTASTMNGLCQGFFSILTLGLITYYIPILGGILFVSTLLFFVASFFIMRQMIRHHRNVVNTDARLLSFLFEAIRSVVKVKTTGSHPRIFTRWLNLELTKISAFMKEQRLLIYHQLLQFSFPPLMTIALFLLATDANPFQAFQNQAAQASGSPAQHLQNVAPTLSLGHFISVQFALAQFFASFMGMIGVMDQLLRLVPVIERIRPILKEKTENRNDPIDGMHDTVKLTPILKGGISLRNVSFRYHPNESLVLNGLNLTIKAGEYVAIVGPSGAGKSTLLKILLGFDSPEEGTISFDDVNMSLLNMSEVRRQMGVVMQHTSLLPGTILDNIRAVNASISEELVWHLLQFVALKEDIEAMAMGLHTIILGDGRTFSMGQRQRLALARCLAKQNAILLLDEPTSALDNAKQATVIETLKHYPATRIMIAHRLTTLQGVDRILVMDKGQIVEEGTFHDLMTSKGFFYNLVRGQF